MNTDKAHLLGEKVYELIILCTEYETRFRAGIPRHDSPEGAWQLYSQMHDKQREIAGMLDSDCFSATKVSLGGSTFSQYMHSGQAISLMSAVGNLIHFCVKAEMEPDNDFRRTVVRNQQYTISRMLDPKAVRERIL